MGAGGAQTDASTTPVGVNEEVSMSVTGVEVDALCLRYAAYPVLSDEQVRTYVAANYAHRGIDEFYRNGGNAPFHKYE